MEAVCEYSNCGKPAVGKRRKFCRRHGDGRRCKTPGCAKVRGFPLLYEPLEVAEPRFSSSVSPRHLGRGCPHVLVSLCRGTENCCRLASFGSRRPSQKAACAACCVSDAAAYVKSLLQEAFASK